MPDDPPDLAAMAADIDEATDALDTAIDAADDALVDAAAARMAAEAALRDRPRSSTCPAHRPTARLVADLTLAEQLDAYASCMPCGQPPRFEPQSPIAGLLRQCAHAVRHLIGQRDEAVTLLRSFEVDHGKWRERYDDDPLVVQARKLLAEVDTTPAYAEPVCTCHDDLVEAGRRCIAGACGRPTDG